MLTGRGASGYNDQLIISSAVMIFFTGPVISTPHRARITAADANPCMEITGGEIFGGLRPPKVLKNVI
jgi:hypothetical protein